MFLNVQASVTNWSQDGRECSLVRRMGEPRRGRMQEGARGAQTLASAVRVVCSSEIASAHTLGEAHWQSQSHGGRVRTHRGPRAQAGSSSSSSQQAARMTRHVDPGAWWSGYPAAQHCSSIPGVSAEGSTRVHCAGVGAFAEAIHRTALVAAPSVQRGAPAWCTPQDAALCNKAHSHRGCALKTTPPTPQWRLNCTACADACNDHLNAV